MSLRPPSAPRSVSRLPGAGRRPANQAVPRRTWLLTFTDLISLTLAFFVMLFAMSGLKLDLWQATVESVTSAFRPVPAAAPRPAAEKSVPSEEARPPAMALDYLAAVLRSTSTDVPLVAKARLDRVSDGLVLTSAATRLFVDNSAVLAADAREPLSVVAGLLRNIENRVAVRVEVASRPEAGAGARRSFARALERSAAVVNALRDAGYDRAIVARAFGTAERREARAQRLEIVILPEGEPR